MQRDIDIFELIQDERERQERGIELIASENFVSDQVMEALSLLTNMPRGTLVDAIMEVARW